MNFWIKVGIWIIWLVLVFYWLNPEITMVKDQLIEHQQQMEKAFNE